jgi:hypothetical protein
MNLHIITKSFVVQRSDAHGYYMGVTETKEKGKTKETDAIAFRIEAFSTGTAFLCETGHAIETYGW